MGLPARVLFDNELCIDGQVEKPAGTVMTNNNSAWKRDLGSFDFEHAIAETLLGHTKNLKTSR